MVVICGCCVYTTYTSSVKSEIGLAAPLYAARVNKVSVNIFRQKFCATFFFLLLYNVSINCYNALTWLLYLIQFHIKFENYEYIFVNHECYEVKLLAKKLKVVCGIINTIFR